MSKVSKQLQCSADYIVGNIDQPWPVIPLSETLESDQPPKWRTGKPPASGHYWCSFDCGGTVLHSDAVYDAVLGVWHFRAGGAQIDSVCTSWVRLPEEADAK